MAPWAGGWGGLEGLGALGPRQLATQAGRRTLTARPVWGARGVTWSRASSSSAEPCLLGPLRKPSRAAGSKCGPCVGNPLLPPVLVQDGPPVSGSRGHASLPGLARVFSALGPAHPSAPLRLALPQDQPAPTSHRSGQVPYLSSGSCQGPLPTTGMRWVLREAPGWRLLASSCPGLSGFTGVPASASVQCDEHTPRPRAWCLSQPWQSW